jgi:YbbR domain-containing protein
MAEKTGIMLRKYLLNRIVLENFFWFLVSLALAFMVWVIAIAQTDPIQERLFTQIPVLISDPDSGLLITNNPTSTVRISVRAQQSVLDSLTKDDFTVRASLSGLGEGTHVVELTAQSTRRAVVDPQPTQITVVLERVEARKVPVTTLITKELAVEYEIVDQPTFDENQVEVSGPASKVGQVVAAQANLDLSQQRNPLEQEVRLIPVDTTGATVEGVTITPQSVMVSVNIRQRADIRQVSVRPQILFDTLPEGYSLSSINYSPQTILISGSQADLANLPNTLDTEPIDLTDRTSDFEVTVSVKLPAGDLLVIGGQTISVSVGMTAPITNRQFDSVPVTVIGLNVEHTAQIAPDTVTVVITGPRAQLEALTVENIQVVVDLNGLEAGNYSVPLRVSITQGAIPAENISVLPANVDVVVQSGAEVTPEPGPGR